MRGNFGAKGEGSKTREDGVDSGVSLRPSRDPENPSPRPDRGVTVHLPWVYPLTPPTPLRPLRVRGVTGGGGGGQVVTRPELSL